MKTLVNMFTLSLCFTVASSALAVNQVSTELSLNPYQAIVTQQFPEQLASGNISCSGNLPGNAKVDILGAAGQKLATLTGSQTSSFYLSSAQQVSVSSSPINILEVMLSVSITCSPLPTGYCVQQMANYCQQHQDQCQHSISITCTHQ